MTMTMTTMNMTTTDTDLYRAGPPGTVPPSTGPPSTGYPAQRASLVDLLDRVLAGGVVVTGEITLSIADVDLVVISLRALLTSVSALVEPEAQGTGTEGGKP
jgi:Gas vesicle protein